MKRLMMIALLLINGCCEREAPVGVPEFSVGDMVYDIEDPLKLGMRVEAVASHYNGCRFVTYRYAVRYEYGNLIWLDEWRLN